MAQGFSSLQRMGWTALAVLFLIVSWLWDQLNRIITAFIDIIPLARLKQRIIELMEQLPPYPTLFVFLIPFIVTEPLKIVSIWMLATGQVVGSVLVYLGAQLIQLGLVSFIFNQCKEKLLSIVWFAHLYAYFQHLHDWADEQVRPLKQRAAALMSELRVYAAAHLGKAGSGMMRHISLLWARMRKH